MTSGLYLTLEVVAGVAIAVLAGLVVWVARTVRRGVVADLAAEVREATDTIRAVNRAVNDVQPGDPTLYELTVELRRLAAEQTALNAEQRALAATTAERIAAMGVRLEAQEARIEQLGGWMHALYSAVSPSVPPWDGTDRRRHQR